MDFFRRLGDAAERAGVLVCLEPNPAMYGCNFMVRTDEAAAIVRAVDHPAIRLQLDVGAIAANGEDATRTIEEHCALIGHVHASEPGLVVLGDGGAPHVEVGAALRTLRPQSIVTVEMAATSQRAARPRGRARAGGGEGRLRRPSGRGGTGRMTSDDSPARRP